MADPTPWLREVPLLAALSDQQIEILGRTLVQQSHPPGHVFFRQGQRAASDTGMFFLAEGSITVSVKKPEGGFALIRTLEEGEVFGLIGLIDPGKARTATVVAGSEVRVAHLTRQAFLTLFHSHHDLSTAFQMVLAQQLVADLNKTDEALRSALRGGQEFVLLPSELVG